MPPLDYLGGNYILRVNDGNDSNVSRDEVIAKTTKYPHKFYNTCIKKDLEGFNAPVVLTVNPGNNTDSDAILLSDPPLNLMFVRVRTNSWNLELVDCVVNHYVYKKVPIVLTFMAYFTQEIPEKEKTNYVFRKRTTNKYYAITTRAWKKIMERYLDNQEYNKWVYSCGKIEGEQGVTGCKHCGTCLREYYSTGLREESAPEFIRGGESEPLEYALKRK
ncbi:MAG: hypothetical protein ACOC5T_09035 [Elusimicrobiota bacterium]